MIEGLDPAIHAPARLQLMALLAEAKDIEFATARSLLEVSDSVLSKHLAQLAEAGYLKLRKAALGGRQRTWIAATDTGRAAFRAHVKALEALVRAADGALSRSSGPSSPSPPGTP